MEFEEFLTMVTKGIERTFEEELHTVFKHFDLTNSGSITEEELFKALQDLGGEFSEEDARMMIKAADFDNDGKVTIQELREFFKD